MSETVSFHRLESYGGNELKSGRKKILVSFETRQYGFYQVGYRKAVSGEYTVEQLNDEPNMMMFSDSEQKYIECVCALVHRMVFDSGKPKELSEHNAY
jgi:hypothetical protein